MASRNEIKALLTLAGKVDPSLHQALLKATGETKRAAAESEKLNKMAAAGAGIVKAAAATFAAGAAGLGLMANKSMQSADELLVMGDKTGLAVEKLQELQYITSQVGGNLETLPNAAKALTTKMAAAAEGTKAAAGAFELLGVKVKDSKGNLRDQSEVFGETLQKLAGMPNITQRNALAFELFGKGAGELFPILNAGSEEVARLTAEANKMGLVMSRDTVDGLDSLGDTISKLQQVGMGFMNRFLGRMAPELQPLLDQLILQAPLIGEKTANAFDKLSKGVGFVADNSEVLVPLVTGLATGLMALRTIETVNGLMALWKTSTFAQTLAQGGLNAALMANPLGLLAAGIGLAVAGGVALYQNWDTVKVKAMELWQTAEQYMPFLKYMAGPIGQAVDAGEYLIRNWDEIMAKAQQLWEKAQKYVAPIAKLLQGPTPAGAAYQSARDKSDSLQKFANGGIATKASIFGEAGAEMAIPLQRTPRSLALLNQTAQMLGSSGNGGVVYHIQVPITVQGNAEPSMIQNMVSAVEAAVERVLEEKVRVAYG